MTSSNNNAQPKTDRSKTIWIINQYATTAQYGLGGRHYYLGQALAAQGHRVRVIAASYHHLMRQTPQLAKSAHFQIEPIQAGLDYVWLRVPQFEGAHHPQRIFNWFRFAWHIRKLKKILPERPDVIVYSSPSPIGSIASRALARHYAVPHVFEVRDIWPLTLVELGGKSPQHPLLKMMQYAEDQAYKHSKWVFSNLFNAVQHMQSRGMDAAKFHWIPNGIAPNELAQPEPLAAALMAQLPKHADENAFVVGYTGSIGLANALDDLIDAAIQLKDQPQIQFVLVGQGLEKARLQAKTLAAGANVSFIDPIAKAQIPSMLQQFDVCYIGWQPHSLYRFGIAPNKLPEYMYAAKPIIHAFSGAGCLVEQAQAGIRVPAQDVAAIRNAIVKLSNMSVAERAQLGQNGHDYVLAHLSYDQIAKKMMAVLANE